MPKPISDPASRFWPKVSKTETCWEWTACRNQYGYGIFGRGAAIAGNCLAHRFAWEMEHGPIPDGVELDHICHNHACVRLDHLRLATRKQNSENRSGAYMTSGTGVRGVSYDKRRGLYRATVTHNYKQIHVGRYETVAEAEEAVRIKRIELFTHNALDHPSSAR